MHARVVTWEGGEGDAMRASIAGIAEQVDAGEQPPGLAATGVTILLDADGGKAMSIMLFETEADMQEGDATLRTMNPPNDGMGKRTSVSFYEVGLDRRL